MSGRDRRKGSVKWFDTQKGFSFITPDDGGDNLFVHQSSIRSEGFRSLAADESVEFDVEDDNTGRRKAVEVFGPNGANVQGTSGGSSDGRGGFGGGRGRSRGGYGGRGGPGGGNDCYKCGEPGHMARDCSEGGGDGGGYGGGGRYGGERGGRGGGGSGNCYSCGDSGHFARDCTSDGR